MKFIKVNTLLLDAKFDDDNEIEITESTDFTETRLKLDHISFYYPDNKDKRTYIVLENEYQITCLDTVEEIDQKIKELQ